MKNLSKTKNMFQIKKSQKFVRRLPDGICRLDSKSYKKYRNTKSTKQSKNFPKKKMMGNTLKMKKIQSFVWRLPDETRLGSLKNNRTQFKFKTP
jgi:hypothetical protein